MKTIRKLLPPLALVGALALVPVTATSFAAADTTNYQELEKFMSVYERVKANYVDQVDDHTLIKGAIDGMLASLDPHSSYVEANDFDQLKATTDGNYGGLGLTGIKERVKDINGSASIETRPGGGTVVHITLPVPATETSKEDIVANSAR